MEKFRPRQQMKEVLTILPETPPHGVPEVPIFSSDTSEDVPSGQTADTRDEFEPAPIVKKSPRMLEIEETIGENIEEYLTRTYVHEGMSGIEISEELAVGAPVVYGWMRKSSIPLRSKTESAMLANPKRSQSIRNAWSDRRAEITAKIHTPESDRKRSESIKRHYDENPSLREYRRKVFTKYAEKRWSEVFGDSIPARLHHMHHIEGLSVEDIAHVTGYSEANIRILASRHGVSIVEKTHKASVRRFQEVQERLWSNPEAFGTLQDNEKHVIFERYMREGVIATLDQVGKEMGVSRARVGQLEKSALRKIREQTT